MEDISRPGGVHNVHPEGRRVELLGRGRGVAAALALGLHDEPGAALKRRPTGRLNVRLAGQRLGEAASTYQDVGPLEKLPPSLARPPGGSAAVHDDRPAGLACPAGHGKSSLRVVPVQVQAGGGGDETAVQFLGSQGVLPPGERASEAALARLGVHPDQDHLRLGSLAPYHAAHVHAVPAQG